MPLTRLLHVLQHAQHLRALLSSRLSPGPVEVEANSVGAQVTAEGAVCGVSRVKTARHS